jgi:hypothetical protein
MGAPPAIIALSRWYPLSKRGTYYGFFSASHNLGEFLSFLFVGAVVGIFGWQWGFVGSSLAGVLGVSCSPTAWGRAGRSRAVSVVRLPCWPCWGSLCGRWGWCWAWAAISGQAAC